jgi:dTDP-glucose pyrophosphorylase
LDYSLTAVARVQIRRVVLVTHYLEEQIQAYVGAGEAWGLEVAFAHQEQMLGTGHALQTALQCRPDWCSGPLLLSATDYILPPDFLLALEDRRQTTGAQIVVSLKALAENEMQQRSSVRYRGDYEVEEVVEKPAPGTAPSTVAANLIYILPAAIGVELQGLQPSTRGEYEVQTAVNALIQRGYRAYGLLQPILREWEPPQR